MKFNTIAKIGILCSTFVCCDLAHANDPMVLLDRDGFILRAHLQAGLNAVAEQNLFWNYAESFGPSTGFDPNAKWLEGYVKPGLSFT